MSNILTTKPPKLTGKYLKFAKSVLDNKSAAQAAINAGYSVRSAYNQSYRLMQNDDIKSWLEYQRAEEARRYEISRADTVPYLRHARDVSMKTEDMNNMIKATTELAKIGGQYNESQSINTRPAFVGISINMGDKPSIDLIEKTEKD